MDHTMNRVVIVGASLAGLRAAETLRGTGFEGSLTVIGAEPHLPYDRPPLSKRVLSGEWEADRAVLRKPDDMGSLDVVWRTGVAATALDLGAREVALADGTSEPFDGLVIASGSAVRRLPGQDDHANAHVLRSLDDSLALRDQLAGGDKRVVVIGAGFIGLEVAATARDVGNEVLVLEGAPAPLMRGLGAEMGAAAAACHADHGVEIRCGVSVAGFEPDAVLLADGTREPADVVVVGVGVAPATEWLADSGLTIADGVVCGADLDAGTAAGHAGVFAAGDICHWHNPLFGEAMRVEHWTNAAEQGALAARNLLASAGGEATEDYAAIPFFWSEQYDRRIQFLGRATADDEVHLFAGSVDERAFAALYGSGGRLRGVLGVNMPRMVMPFRRHFESAISWDDALAVAAELAG